MRSAPRLPILGRSADVARRTIMTTSCPAIASVSLLPSRTSAAGARRQVRRIPIPLHLDVAERLFDLAQVLSSQCDGRRTDVLLQAVHLGGARDGHDPRLLR